MLAVPHDVPSDLAERFRQLDPFERAEVALVRALVAKPERLEPQHERVLRRALNLARIWVLDTEDGDVVVGSRLGKFRDSVRKFADEVLAARAPDPGHFGPHARRLAPELAEARRDILSKNLGRFSAERLDHEIRNKKLVLAVGGGGGCGYVHLGVFGALEAHGIRPSLVTGSSIGSILGLFRAREMVFREATVRAVTHGLSYSRMFKFLDSETRYAMPGALRLQLRTWMSRFFTHEGGEIMKMGQLELPFLVVVTGVRREAARRARDFEAMVQREIRRGTVGRLLHLRDLTSNLVAFLREMLSTPGGLEPIVLGQTDETREFDVLDAAGFSSALPGVIQYDITRNDPRMQALMKATLEHHEVDYLADGGISSNVPVRAAWEAVQRGRVQTRNVMVLGLDCFAPQLGRNMMYLPLMRIAAENVMRDRPFAHEIFTYRRTLAPTALVPSKRALSHAISTGRREFSSSIPFIQKMLEPA